MAATPVYAAYVPQYAGENSYVTVDEFLASPSGADATQLIPGADVATNRDALAGVILRASATADNFVQQVLGASIDTQTAPPKGWQVRPWASGRAIQVAVDNTPVVAVTGVRLGYDPANIQELTSLAGVWPARKVITIPVAGLSSVPAGAAPGSGPFWPGRGNVVWGAVDYMNGFFNSTLTTAVASGDATFTPASTLGLYPGLSFMTYDSTFARSEPVTVAASYVPGATPVPTLTPFTYPHKVGVSVSALPPSLRQAVIFLTAALIKARGSDAMILASINDHPGATAGGEAGISDDEARAYALLESFKRVR